MLCMCVLCMCEWVYVCLCAYMRMNERNKKWSASVLVGRRADEGVDFKRNKCWCCSVIFVKKKTNNKKRGEGWKKERERETKGVHETIEGPDILRDLHEHKKTKKKDEKEWKATRREIAWVPGPCPDPRLPPQAEVQRKEKKSEREREREINETWRECENEPRVRRVVLLNCTGCKIYSLSVSKEKKKNFNIDR